MRVLAAVTFTILLGFGSLPAAAQTNRAAVTEARKLMEVMRSVDTATQMLTQINSVMMNVVAKANPGLEAEVRKAMDEVFLPEIKLRLPEFVDEMAGLYAAHFSLDELQQLNAFYLTPLGRKLIDSQPTLMQQSAAMGQVWGQKTIQDVMQKIAPKLRERGIKNL